MTIAALIHISLIFLFIRVPSIRGLLPPRSKPNMLTATIKEESGHQATIPDVSAIYYTRDAADGPEINFVSHDINNIFAFSPMTHITITPQDDTKEEAICWGTEKLT